jgi:glycosyltransferase involved in cell wall biosynthesis
VSSRTILHVIETPGPGGAESVLASLVRGGEATHARSVAIVPTVDGWLGRTLPEGTRRVVAPSPRGDSGVLDRRYLRGLRTTIDEARPVLVHAHSFDAAFYAALALRGREAPLIATFHGASDVERRTLRDRLKWLAFRRAKAIVCVSHALQARARSVAGVPHRVLRTVHNGIDMAAIPTTRHARLRQQLRLAPSARLLGALGNVRAPKGYDLLLPAVRALCARGVDVHLAIAGDASGALGDGLRAQRDSLGLTDHVTLLGYQEDAGEFLSGLDLFVLSSTSEGFSLSTVQAMAAGLPVVATRSGGPEEIVESEASGLLVEAGSPDALSAGIERVIRDPALAERLGAAARRRATDAFSLDAMLRGYGEIYDAVLAR